MTSCVLALESGASTASVALIDPCGGLRWAKAESGQSHSSQLIPLAQGLMDQAGVSWQQMDGIAVGIGPGSFTGLRIACGVAQGLALGTRKPLMAINGFEAWSYAWWMTQGAALAKDLPAGSAHQAEPGSSGMQSALKIDMSFDARLGERFHALLMLRSGVRSLEMNWIEPPSVLAHEQWKSRNHDASTVVLADCDADALGQELPLAAWMARYACDPACQHAHRWLSPGELRPLYVRDKVAQTIEERQHAADLQWTPMTERDIASVMVIEHQAYPFPWSSGNFLDSLRAGYDMQVLKERGVMIGYLVWMRVLREAHLLNVTLSPARQGHGLGSWMMRQFISRLRGMDIDEVLLEVRPSNHAALALYRKCGFTQVGIRKAYYPNHALAESAAAKLREDAIVMQLTLGKMRQAKTTAADQGAALEENLDD